MSLGMYSSEMRCPIEMIVDCINIKAYAQGYDRNSFTNMLAASKTTDVIKCAYVLNQRNSWR